MRKAVLIKTYAALPRCDRNEILRYAGARGDEGEDLQALLDECLRECDGAFSPRVCYTALTRAEFLGIFPQGESVRAWTEDCETIVLFAATVGLEIDRLVNRYSSVSAAKALLFQAIGAERIESLCDKFCEEYTTDGACVGRRFSPGYGDFPLATQKEIFALLNPSKHIGVTLTESLLMSPTKSVTAAFGIKIAACDKRSQEEKCESCTQENCAVKRD